MCIRDRTSGFLGRQVAIQTRQHPAAHNPTQRVAAKARALLHSSLALVGVRVLPAQVDHLLGPLAARLLTIL
eukprot:3592046-Pyramimonas_sp.AAC.1